MFGYVNVYKPDLKVKEYYKYRAYYCGFCKRLNENYGHFGQMTLSYDLTFLIVLLTSLYESKTVRGQERCIAHPVKTHDYLCNEITDYVADMNIALTYYKLLDDWMDEKSLPGLAGTKVLARDFKRINAKYPRQCKGMKASLEQLAENEKKNISNIDLVSRSFGELMGELFVYRDDAWKEILRTMGFFLGKFIYILDAYDDIEKDIKNNSFNPLKSSFQNSTFSEDCRNILTMMMAECTRQFELLPCIEDIEILRNILYQGVWVKFETITSKRLEINEEKLQKEGTKI